MDRRYRDLNDRTRPGLDYDRYQRSDRNDDTYYNARHLDEQFERDYQRERGGWHDTRSQYPNSYQNDRRDSFGQDWRERDSFRNDFGYQRNDRDRERNYSGNFSHDRDRYSSYQDDFRGDQGLYRGDRDRDESLRGNIRQGYGISSYDGTSDRFNTLDSDRNREGAGDDQVYYSGDRDGYESSRFGGGIGDSFPGSHRGVPDTSYGLGNFSDGYSVGTGSSYGGKNYGGGTGYQTGHRGGSFGNHTYGNSAGNYGGYGSMQGGTYGGRTGLGGDTSHNSNRYINELGGFS
ncbi:hypothetical protein CLV24_11563 [Pontibacter ummariensis]|uniref:Uncharacterized protein n=1 Tax=Pontibacter ummariensis TaxID=1610492 RepID=A0A239HZS4_9BACT|nr:hypothetical protein [Pontibacter ummariensis]PRY10146.1 hypothetical protein CLV24_11563 [Pontibacter ummariensis]SNS86880.1 hypothetical protein SAMN06296052_11563 [Pontibacter ummariensis]